MATTIIELDGKVFDISYTICNPNQTKTIFFLHGWGANKELMQKAFDCHLQNYKHIYVDLCGFGRSSNNYKLNTFDYAKIMENFLQYLQIVPDIIVGHSFGGKVATLLNPPLLVLLSTAGIVEDKSSKTLLSIKMAKIFNKFGLGRVSKLLRSSDVNMMSENMYATFKNVVDEDFAKYFDNFSNNCIIFWGKNDTATTLSSGKFIHRLIENSQFVSYDGDHFFFLKYSDDIVSKIITKLHKG